MSVSRRVVAVASISLVVVSVILSFRAYAPALTPDLSSDHAVQILMAYDLELPGDLYYWGQDRLGSLVPILGHLLLKISSFPPIQAVSYIQYFLLAVGYLCISNIFKRPISKLIFALAWFLPLSYFETLLQIAQPYSPQFACLGVAIALVNRMIEAPEQFEGNKRQFYLTATVVSLFLSLWVSELSIVTLMILFGIALKDLYGQVFEKSVDLKRSKNVFLDVLNIGIVSLLGILFIFYAKQNASGSRNYAAFNSIDQTIEVISKLFVSLLNTITFQSNNLFLSIHAVLVLLLVGYFIWLILKRQGVETNFPTSRWFYLFLANAFISFILLLFSHWVYINQISLRYFVVVYISCWISALLFVEGFEGKTKRVAYTLLTLMVISSSLSLPSYVFSLAKPESKIQQLQAVQSLGKVSFIGEYWNSYVLCSVNPAKLNCTPHDPRETTSCPSTSPRKPRIRGVRCSRCANQVLRSKTIYLVKEDWLEAFPNEIQQFRQCLVKVGEAKQVAGYTMAPYTRKPVN